jgi:Xaa-Pro aminopeptidase
MFQSFEVKSDASTGPARLAALRAELARSRLAGFIVPRADAHQGEYVAPSDERLGWLTGFTGSAGFCIVLPDIAGIFVDGRYRTQVKSQVDLAHFTPVAWPEVKPGDWLRERASGQARIGLDPWLHTAKEISAIEAALAGSTITLVPVDNPVDAIWHDRPAPPRGPVTIQALEQAGESHADKRSRLGAELVSSGQKAAVLTLPDSLSWLLNIRGSDIARNPVVQGFAILHATGHVTAFIEPEKIPDDVRAHLGPEITLRPISAFAPALRTLKAPVRVDRATAPMQIWLELDEAGVAAVDGPDPCILPKARKNPVEIAGAREAHLRDGAAMVEFLAWFAREAPGGGLSEIDVVSELEQFRRATNALREISFETICGAGPNGAIMHYRVTKETNRRLNPGEIVVVDSGGQYLDGTTDITRTVAIGRVDDEIRACFTRVLQGMIAISRLRWPKGVAGQHLDAIARYPLWLAGQDFDHGTGHGVGSYLSVHEGPQRLSRLSDVPLEPGMILSNEPGYYREGAFGIRIENLVIVGEAAALPGGDDGRKMLDFETLTFVPIDRNLVVAAMLSDGERQWLDAYHAEVRERIAPRVSDRARDWLMQATAPI